MSCILVHPADEEESKKSAKNIVATGECDFGLEENVARLRPVSYGSCLCTDMEKKFHPFVG